jgi:nucleotide-binding universal stress UspA family protein
MMLSAKRKPEQVIVHSPPRGALRPKILCATDLSSRSEQAVARTLKLCEALAGHALLLHVVADDVPLRLAGRRADRARSALLWHTRQFSRMRIDLDVSVRVGPALPSIAAAAESWGADLVVLGLHRERWSSALGGSTAERLAHRIRRPVLVVNADARQDYNGVTFIADKHTSVGVQLADRFDLITTANASFVPRLSLMQRFALALAQRLESRAEWLAQRAEDFARDGSQQAIEDAGLHLMGFEFVNGRTTPRALISRIVRGQKPQLLVAGVSRSPLRIRDVGRQSVLSALRARVCDVLLFSETRGPEVLRSLEFAAPSGEPVTVDLQRNRKLAT